MTDIRVVGTSPALMEALGYRPESGRFITPLDERSAHSVCVLGIQGVCDGAGQGPAAVGGPVRFLLLGEPGGGGNRPRDDPSIPAA